MGNAQKFISITKNVIVDVHRVQVKAHFFVIDKINQANYLLLGSPYQWLVELSI